VKTVLPITVKFCVSQNNRHSGVLRVRKVSVTDLRNEESVSMTDPERFSSHRVTVLGSFCFLSRSS